MLKEASRLFEGFSKLSRQQRFERLIELGALTSEDVDYLCKGGVHDHDLADKLQQNFLTKPSILEFVAKIILTRVEDNQILASRLIQERISCPSDTPYGGVIAANRAAEAFTRQAKQFVIQNIRKDLNK